MRIGLDLDGVVCDFTADYGNQLYKDYGVRPKQSTEWDGFVEKCHNVFADDQEFWVWLRTTDVWWDSPVIENALEGVEYLHKAGHDIVVITSKPMWAIPRTLHWLSKHAIPTSEIHFTGGDHRKKKSEIKCDVYIDDSPSNLQEYVDNCQDAVIVRQIRPWNFPIEGTQEVRDLVGLAYLVEGL